ncbi:hypothetical protein RSC2_01063 [Bacillus paralicheniformis]|nr:hypothetical protein RSC1_03616 [Bacillus paralicheniformis]BCE09267.1 hypothetical protein RSC2_01063 [Bacillus paralicheniformis]BCE15411.1 hypothetical protein RSC3_02767 [Bacillus paralicheniformis]
MRAETLLKKRFLSEPGEFLNEPSSYAIVGGIIDGIHQNQTGVKAEYGKIV